MDIVQIIGLVVLGIILVIMLIYYFLVPRTVVVSEPQGDYVGNKRSAKEVGEVHLIT